MVPRKLRRNDATYSPRRIAILHCKTVRTNRPLSPKKFRRYFKSAYLRTFHYDRLTATRESEYLLPNKENVWQILDSFATRHNTTWLVTFNAKAQLAASGLWQEIDAGRISFDYPRAPRNPSPAQRQGKATWGGLFVIESPPTIIGLRMPSGGRIVLVDTLNWSDKGIADLAEWCDEPEPIESTLSNDELDEPRKLRWTTNVLKSFFLGLVNWVHSEDLGQFRWTIASQAMSAFRHRFMHHDIVIHHDTEIAKLERESYFGGTVEIHRIGRIDETVTQFDVNSLYPYVMLQNQYPASLKSAHLSKRWRDGVPPCYPRHSIAKVLIHSPEPIYPVRHRGETVFPIGRFPTTLAGPELDLAILNGHVIAYCSWAEYHCCKFLHAWASYWLGKREELRGSGRPLEERLSKLIANSLYGKWGQRTPPWVPVPRKVPPFEWGKWIETNLQDFTAREFQAIGGKAFMRAEPQEHQNAFPAISAFVTAYGREYMERIKLTAGRANLIYQSCDSVCLTDSGVESLRESDWIHERASGALKPVCSSESGIFLAVNCYRIGDKLVRSGVKATQADKLHSGIEQIEAPSIRQSVKRGPVDYVAESKRTLVSRLSYTKGLIQNDGRVLPIELWDDPRVDADPELMSVDAIDRARRLQSDPLELDDLPF